MENKEAELNEENCLIGSEVEDFCTKGRNLEKIFLDEKNRIVSP